MKADLAPFFQRYAQLVRVVDATFDRIKQSHPEGVKCTEGCSDCCHAVFDIGLIEALYIKDRFERAFEADTRERFLEKANRADRQAFAMKRQVSRAVQAGRDARQVMEVVAAQRLRCLFLNEADGCDIYDFRPITCRLYGVPTAIQGEGHTCGRSGFTRGAKYPTVNLDRINDQLYTISRDLVVALESRFAGLANLFIPVSMAVLTDFDETYLGIDTTPRETKVAGNPGKA